MLSLVLTTPRQSRGRALPSRGRGSEWVGSGSERETTRHAYVGMPRESLVTPNEGIVYSVELCAYTAISVEHL
jgi:hypothetical protein